MLEASAGQTLQPVPHKASLPFALFLLWPQLASFAIVVNQLKNIYDAFFINECDRCRGTGLVTCPHVRKTALLPLVSFLLERGPTLPPTQALVLSSTFHAKAGSLRVCTCYLHRPGCCLNNFPPLLHGTWS